MAVSYAPFPSPPEIACMLIALPSGQPVMVGNLSRTTVIEGVLVEASAAKATTIDWVPNAFAVQF
jgi:hypothetical protein